MGGVLTYGGGPPDGFLSWQEAKAQGTIVYHKDDRFRTSSLPFNRHEPSPAQPRPYAALLIPPFPVP